MKEYEEIIRIILERYPFAQAVYLSGTYDTPAEWPDSDVDVAILIPPVETRRQPQLILAPCHVAPEEALGKQVDLINARQVSTVFQKEIMQAGRRIYCADENAAMEFEMLTLSFYGKLNEERKEILAAFRETGKAYNV